ncbi:putative leucine-rich repeat domain superfamily, F-box-like domain superfamily [Helianthus annuus]|nr:putative leucine-rich repeat domain superfamily, F-box-like domain superfamily [Helianthus annuus]
MEETKMAEEEEKSQTQPETLKRIRFEDRISSLPDCLLIEILSRLPSTKHAITTTTLSKRWQHLWTSLHTLIFTHHKTHNHPQTHFYSYVDKTLSQCHHFKLNKFTVYTCYDYRFESQVNNWIRYAVNCNVQELNLTLWNVECEAEFLLDQFFFNCCCFTNLKLSGCVFNPIGDVKWSKLNKLWISHANLDEGLIENVLSGSPVLETLVLDNCYGYRRVNITSKSVKKLVFSGYMVPDDDNVEDVVEINAPGVLSLAIHDDLLLWKLSLVDVSSLVEADLDYTKGGHYDTTTPKEAEEEMLKGFILDLRHVKELKIGIFCFKVLCRLEAKGFVFPSNLKVHDVTSSPLYSDDDSMGFSDWSDSDSATICMFLFFFNLLQCLRFVQHLTSANMRI